MNSFLLSLTVLLIVALSALFAIPYFVDFNDYRDVFEAQATKVMGREVAVRGPVALKLLPVPELRFEQVTVANADGGTALPFMEAHSLQASLNIGALLRGTVETQQLTIVDPVLRLNVNPDGTGAWSDVGLHEAALPFAPKRVAFDSVTVTGGRIEIYRQGEAVAAIRDIDGEATAGSLTGPYKVSATYLFDDARQEIRFSTGTAEQGGDFRLKARISELASGTALLFDGLVGGLRTTPHYDGDVTARLLPYRPPPLSETAIFDGVPIATRQDGDQDGEGAQPQPAPPQPQPRDAMSLVEMKGKLEARPNRVALSPFELTIHSRGRSQMLKGKFAVDLVATEEATGEVSARWVDVDALLSDPEAAVAPDPASRLQRLAVLALQQAGRFDAANFDIRVDQASLGGDLVTDIDLKLASEGDRLTIESLDARLPGDTEIDVEGVIAKNDFHPVFKGKLGLAGERLATLTRWAVGERGLAGKASAGEFSFQANAELSPDIVVLSEIQGEISGTNFGGALRYETGEQRTLDLALESERLDLREVMGEGGVSRLWAGKPEQAADGSQAEKTEKAGKNEPEASETDLWQMLTAFQDDTVHIALALDELLLPEMPTGALDARLDYANDRLSIRALEFESPGALMVTGEGELTGLSDKPQGRIALSVKGEEPESLKTLAGTFGLGDRTIANFAPVDLRLVLAAEREGETSLGRLEASGTMKGATVDLHGSARGDLSELGKTDMDIEGEIEDITLETLISLVAPDLSDEERKNRLAENADAKNSLAVALKGVPEDGLKLSLALAGPLEASFAGEGAYREETLTLQGQVNARADDAAMLLALAGVAVPPSARDLPVDLRGKLAKKQDEIHLYPLTGAIGDEAVELGAHVLMRKPETKIYLDATADTVSLPALLGPLVAWERTASTEEMLGTVTQGRADLWPARGFSLGPLAWAKTQLHVKAKTMHLGSAFPLKEAQFKAQSNDGKLDIKVLKGKLFDGLFTAAGKLEPRGEGAHLDIHAELAAAKMSQTSRALLGDVRAKSEYGFNIHLTGEGLSPPGLVAGLSGKGRLTLRPGEIRGLNADAYAKMLRQAVKTDQNRVNEEEIVGLAETLQTEITEGVYPFDAAVLDFEVQNGTLRMKNGRLANDEAVTKISGLVALSSLRLDSEWSMSLRNPPVADAPPVTLVLAGPLERIGEITPRIDTDALVGHFTVRRMQQDVERLENLDVTGQGPPEPAPLPPPKPKPQSSREPAGVDAPDNDMAPEEAAIGAAPSSIEPEAAALPEADTATEDMDPEGTPATIEELLETEEEPSPGEDPSMTAEDDSETGTVSVPNRRPPPPPRRRSASEPAPDDWKRGISIFGYGP
ncbi:MAG: AsmA family protein [Methyloligella sp. ZOD6]